MSVAAVNHVKARWEGLLPSDKLILSAIAERTEKSRGCWPSRRMLANDTGLSLDTVKRSLKRLAEKRFIHRSGRMNESGSRASSLIEIVGFTEMSSVGARCTQAWVQENPQGGCSEAPRVGAASPLTYKDEPKIEPKIEPKREIGVADAREPTLELILSETSSPDPLEAFHSYNQAAEEIGLPVARSLPPGRRKSLNARFREHGVGSWAIVLANIRASDFLQGKNDRRWRPNLDWIIKPENYTKILEGNYAPALSAPKPKSIRQGLRAFPLGTGQMGAQGSGGCAMNQHFRLAEPMVLTLGERLADECRVQGLRHVADVSAPYQLLDSDGKLRSEFSFFESYVILIPPGGEALRDDIAINVGDDRCRWAYVPDDPRNIPAAVMAAKRMWIDEIARLDDIPDPGPVKLFETGFAELDRYGLRLTTPAFMPIVGPYGSGKSIFLRQLLINLWRLHGWRFLLTSFEERVKPRFQRDLRRHLIGTVEETWTEQDIDHADAELNRAAVFLRRKRNTLLDADRLIDRIEYAVRVYRTSRRRD